MTGALIIYSATFMRYALAVTPKNYLLFACHFVNEGAQLTQGYRYMNYWGWSGKERALKQNVKGSVDERVVDLEAKAKGLIEKAAK